MNLPDINFSLDLVILGVMVLTVLVGVLLGSNKVKTFALSVYVGIVVATEFGTGLYGLLQKNNLDLGGRLTPGSLRLGLFVLPMIALEAGRRQHGRRERGGLAMTLVLSVLVAALVISSALQLLEPDSLRRVLDGSALAGPIHRFRLWWVAAVPVAVIGESFIRSREQ
ncbi:hypothetical protein KY386_02025 [Candidatus Parcubacteria bacterium]|nr:hypothetical protein [Candidatus Parcubacteria bacterium]